MFTFFDKGKRSPQNKPIAIGLQRPICQALGCVRLPDTGQDGERLEERLPQVLRESKAAPRKSDEGKSNMLQTERLPRQLPIFVCVWLGLTALLIPFDGQIRALINCYFGQHVLRPVLTFYDFMGGYAIHGLTFAILVTYCPKRETVIRYITLMAGSAVFCTLIKYVVGRSRPYMHRGPYVFHPFSHPTIGIGSFPSGQAASAMALATMLGFYFPKARWAFWAFAIWGALGRIAEKKHFASDVIFGAGLGYFFVVVGAVLLARWGNEKPVVN